MKITRLGLILLFVAGTAHGKDFGVMGVTFPVQENNLVTVIKQRLADRKANGEVETLRDTLQREAIRKRTQPDPVLITKATVTRDRLFDPTVKVTQDLTDTHGRIFAKKGQEINPLQYIALTKKMYFIDADDEKQMQWLEKETLSLNDKVILTNGDTLTAEKQLNRRIYFDQHADLIKRLNIVAVPSVVSQQGDRLLIREINIDE